MTPNYHQVWSLIRVMEGCVRNFSMVARGWKPGCYFRDICIWLFFFFAKTLGKKKASLHPSASPPPLWLVSIFSASPPVIMGLIIFGPCVLRRGAGEAAGIQGPLAQEQRHAARAARQAGLPVRWASAGRSSALLLSNLKEEEEEEKERKNTTLPVGTSSRIFNNSQKPSRTAAFSIF